MCGCVRQIIDKINISNPTLCKKKEYNLQSIHLYIKKRSPQKWRRLVVDGLGTRITFSVKVIIY